MPERPLPPPAQIDDYKTMLWSIYETSGKESLYIPIAKQAYVTFSMTICTTLMEECNPEELGKLLVFSKGGLKSAEILLLSYRAAVNDWNVSLKKTCKLINDFVHKLN